MERSTDCRDMTIAVDWDNIAQTKHSKRLIYKCISIENKLVYHMTSRSSLDKQRICVNTQLNSSNKQLKLNVCVPKSNSVNQYAITCDVIAYHLVHFISICVIYKCQSGIDFFSTSQRTV